MAKDPRFLELSNPGIPPGTRGWTGPRRRTVLRGGLGAAVGSLLAPLAPATARAPGSPLLGFTSVPVSRADAVTVPAGYLAELLAPWGEPVGLPGRMPAFRPDGGNSAAEQEAQLGMHHDGMAFFPLDEDRGLLVLNHEYTDEALLHGSVPREAAERVAKSQAAVGIAVLELARDGARWRLVRPSPLARRITARTPVALGGPATGHALLRTAQDPAGRQVLGTLANCAGSRTPWGTYLAGEENFIGYFHGPDAPDAHQRRWGLRPDGYGLRWHAVDERFDATRHPHEPHRFGWIVEVDPFDPAATPVKRTALGRGAHEGATVAVTREGRAVVYSGEDAAFEHVYKFVSRDRIRPGGGRANAQLLDHGTLYVARFDADGRGHWLPLVHGRGPLTAAAGFADQGEVLVKARQASDALGGTAMDRPEWIAVGSEGWVYVALTSNHARGAPGQPAPDAANPRPRNTMGHILRWRETGDFDATSFHWEHFVLAGRAPGTATAGPGSVPADAFACPDGLVVDGRGVLWIQTDMPTGRGETADLGNNMLLAADPGRGELRRFLVGPPSCEITGATFSPDNRTLFVNIQHPGEGGTRQPQLRSTWPDHRAGMPPRSATVMVRKRDGGVIGS